VSKEDYSASTIQKGNPHALTRRQHVFPKASIERFANARNLVTVVWTDGKRPFLATTENPIFCVDRLWDQKSEDMAKVHCEDPFQSLAEECLSCALRDLSDHESHIASAMYGLWLARTCITVKPLADQKLNGILGALDSNDRISQDEGEKLEKSHIIVPQTNEIGEVEIPGRMFAWPRIENLVRRTVMDAAHKKWGLLVSPNSIFCIPDTCPDAAIIPISPRRFLAWGITGQLLSDISAGDAESKIRATAKRFYVAEGPQS